MFKKIRILVLTVILLFVATSTWLDALRSADWSHTQRVVIYPINGDQSEISARYISQLSRNDFHGIETYIEEQAKRYGVSNPFPIDIDLAPQITDQPPEIPENGGTLSVIAWSLSLRFWAWRHGKYDGATPQIRLLVRYFDPATNLVLRHSAGLRKGQIGIIQAFSSNKMSVTNKVIITHELLHTFGAGDHYDPATNLPVFPDGYAAPDKTPRYPQSKAEIMGGRIPLSEKKAVIPKSLRETMIGPLTARQIHWLQP